MMVIQPNTKTRSVESAGAGVGMGAAAPSERVRLAVAYNDALNRCTQTGGANIDELMDLFAEDATWVVGGVRNAIGVASTSLVGKDAIRASFLARTALYQQEGELKGIDVWGDLVVCRGERRDTTFTQPGFEPQVRILLVKGGKIQQVVVVADPEAYARMRSPVRPSRT
jgi:ketosteroid isomerase-like protein